MHRITLGAIFLLIGQTTCDLTEEYYKNLLNENLAASARYQLPNSSFEFLEGVQSSRTSDYGTYDFIIIGAGSAGNVLATRLSENRNWKILLLEAGGEETDFSNIPNPLLTLIFSDLNWGYKTAPQTNCCLGMKEKSCMVPRGKVIGGSSSINAMMYVRGNPRDYNNWERLGNPGWSFKHVLPYFLKSENSQVGGDRGYHANGGLLNVQFTNPSTPLFPNLLDANLELNQPTVDFNGRRQIGVSSTPYNILHGKRQSTGKAFLDYSRQRANLQVLTRTLATRIIINNRKVATGVEFVRNNKKFQARAKREVILSAGAYNSPQLLMLSGVGPKNHLNQLGIEVIQDLPVGEKLLEHPMYPGLAFRTNYTNTETFEETVKPFLRGEGFLTRPSNNDGIGFVHGGKLPASVPMIEYIFIPPNSSSEMVPRLLNFDDEIVDSYFNQVNAQTDIVLFTILLHENSRGSVRLKSRNPTDFPVIDYNFFAEPEDIDNFIEGFDFLFKLMETKAFQRVNATWLPPKICGQFPLRSRAFWECVLRKMALSIFHPCGTTPMGPRGVVDHNLNVRGIERLRVVDAGVMPSTISGHTNAPTIMIAEKISDHIKKQYA